jgi:tolkin
MIIIGQHHNFEKYTTTVDTMGLPYDYYSVMHYERNAFAIDMKQDTVVPKQRGITLEGAWTKNSLTETDIAEIRKYYNCV